MVLLAPSVEKAQLAFLISLFNILWFLKILIFKTINLIIMKWKWALHSKLSMGSFTYYVINFWPIFTPPLSSVINFTVLTHVTITCSVIIDKPPLPQWWCNMWTTPMCPEWFGGFCHPIKKPLPLEFSEQNFPWPPTVIPPTYHETSDERNRSFCK